MLIEIHFAWLLLDKQLKYDSLSFPEHQRYVLSEHLPSFSVSNILAAITGVSWSEY